MKEKLVTVFGTRPEIIRLSALLPKLDQFFDHKIINTYQNYLPQLNDIFIDELKIRKPDYDLKIEHIDYGKKIGNIIEQTHKILKEFEPDKLLVLGDTYSSMTVLPASNMNIKIYHMEAGMRSGNWNIPEEKNRKIIDHLSNINMPYPENSRKNLIKEGINPLKIFVTGNPIIEVLEKYMGEIDNSQILNELNLIKGKYFVVTIHRYENVSDYETMKNLIKTLIRITNDYPNDKLVVFTHPRFLESMESFNFRLPPQIRLRKNTGFFDFVQLQKNAKCVLTDSGTVPEECTYLKVPCIILRNNTERPEFVDLGSNIIAGTKIENIMNSLDMALTKKPDWDWEKSLGDGRTSEKVIRILRNVI